MYLDKRHLDATMPQSWVSSISTAFVFCFRSLLLSALASAFAQQIWHLFRKKPLHASTIDLLYTVLKNPVNLLYPELIRHAPFEFIFALMCWVFPIATVFPPGAIRVIPFEQSVNQSIEVPTFDPRYVGENTTEGDLRTQALFSMNQNGSYT